MSSTDPSQTQEAFKRRAFGLPLLRQLVNASEHSLTFGKLMENLKISKRGLSLTLTDFESQGYIERSKRGRNTYVSITIKGLDVLDTIQIHITTKDAQLAEIVKRTVHELEIVGLIKKEWTSEEREVMIERIRQAIVESRD